MLAILDYKAGNQTSVLRALQHLGIPAAITADKAELSGAEGIIFPGVGSASQAMGVLQSQGLDIFLKEAVARHQPLLGICLGCQILLESSEEGPTQTLGILKGHCKKFPDTLKQEDGTHAPVPHMGWNSVVCEKENALFAGVDKDAQFYFVHSYYVEPAPELATGFTEYGGLRFCSFYGRPGLWATQFHLEKSSRAGQIVLKNFYAYCKEQSHAV